MLKDPFLRHKHKMGRRKKKRGFCRALWCLSQEWKPTKPTLPMEGKIVYGFTLLYTLIFADTTHDANDYQKWFSSVWIYSFGTDIPARAPNALICSILGELHSHCHEKLEFNESHLPKLKPSYSYILFLIFNLSFISFCYSLVFTPKILMSFVLEKNIISFRDCMTQLFFLPIFCELRELCTYSHSIGSLCGHLSAIAVQGCYVP